MQKKQMLIVPKGMQQDIAVSQFPSDTAYSIKNMRLVSEGANTTLCLTNEKGNRLVIPENNTIEGIVLGQCYVENYVVIFTHSDTNDYIYKIEKDAAFLTCTLLYKGNLNLDLEHPIECVTSIETNNIHKVYWVDGKNELRVIETKSHTYDTNHTFEITAKNLELQDDITVNKSLGDGVFNAGIIQYAYSYYNFNGLETPIINSSCINYIATEQGIQSDKTVGCAFNITIKNLDTQFEYLRLYSIQRTSLNSTPIVKRVIDVKIDNTRAVFITDNNTIGEIVDPKLLLYLGGDRIIAGTLATKDNTLFLGNIKENSNYLTEQQRIQIEDAISLEVPDVAQRKQQNIIDNGYTSYKGNLNSNANHITTFKYMENYRLGIQFQFDDATLSDVIYVCDIQNNIPPSLNGTEVYMNIPSSLNLPSNIKRARIMIVAPKLQDRTRVLQGIVSPTVFECKSRANNYLFTQPSWLLRDLSYKDNNVIKDEIQSAQGNHNIVIPNDIINDFNNVTIVYWHEELNISDTIGGEVVPKHKYQYEEVGGNNRQSVIDENATKGYKRIKEKFSKDYGADKCPSSAEWNKATSSSTGTIVVIKQINTLEQYISRASNNNDYYIDSQLVTFYSPEIENTYSLINSLNTINTEIVGCTKTPTIYNDYIVTASNALRSLKEKGEVQLKRKDTLLKSDFLWNDVTPDSNPVELDKNIYYPWVFKTYMWHREGSLNGDNKSNNELFSGANKDTWDKQYSLLNRKVFLNVRDYKTNYYLRTPINTTKNTYKIHLKDYEGIYNIGEGNNYKGIVDIINNSQDTSGYLIKGIPVSKQLGVYGSILQNKEQAVTSNDKDILSNDPVHITYRTGNHLLINLNSRLPLTAQKAGELTTLDIIKYKNLVLVNELTVRANLPNIVTTEEKNKRKVGYTFFVIGQYGINKDLGLDKIYKITSYTQQGDQWKVVYSSEEVTNYIDVSEGKLFYVAVTVGDIFEYRVVGNITIEEESGSITFTKIEGGHSVKTSEIEITDSYDTPNIDTSSMYIMDICKEVSNQYGGDITNKDGDSLMQQVTWIPVGDFTTVNHNNNTYLSGSRGDTYYQRWDCLATYPYSKDNKNQVLDIVSFLIESRINLDGNTSSRGEISVNLDYNNFYNINSVYSQQDNYFSRTNIVLKNLIRNFPYDIVMSSTKVPNSEIDAWTNIKMVNSTQIDSQYGYLTKLHYYNNYIYFFQEKAVGVVNFNSRVQVNTSDGVPIELANSGKLDGVNYINTNYGCINKWAIIETSTSMYFVDDLNKSIMAFNGQQFMNLTQTKNMYSWLNTHISSTSWNPTNNNTIRVLYDKLTKDIYFTSNTEALAFNEKLGNFSSIYNYGNVSFLFTLENNSYQVYNSHTNNTLYELQAGDEYCNFFNNKYNYHITLIANQEFQQDKVFDTVEFRTDGTEYINNGVANDYPFIKLTAQNEYQSSISNTTNLKKKFRTWRWRIGRHGILNNTRKDRIRNNWVQVTLEGNRTDSIRLYDTVITYYM